MNEREWTEKLRSRLQGRLRSLGPELRVADRKRLVYAHQIVQYGDGGPESSSDQYQTDLLVYEEDAQRNWTPRVVIECKLGEVTTHDAITYSAKAATHKNVHPYLVYGILVGNFRERSLPSRLLRHGTSFDFMMVWPALEPTAHEWRTLNKLLRDYVEASRTLQDLATAGRRQSSRYRLLHRRVEFR